MPSKTLVAGSGLHALLGHSITVAGHRLLLGLDGRCEVPAEVADVLLKQQGWSEAVPAEDSDNPGGKPGPSGPGRIAHGARAPSFSPSQERGFGVCPTDTAAGPVAVNARGRLGQKPPVEACTPGFTPGIPTSLEPGGGQASRAPRKCNGHGGER